MFVNINQDVCYYRTLSSYDLTKVTMYVNKIIDAYFRIKKIFKKYNLIYNCKLRMILFIIM